MLAKARESGLYDNLIKAELTEFLSAAGPQYDLIAAGDTLCYFGDLSGVLSLIAQRLRRGGLLIASFELCKERGADGFKLHPHGRYSHLGDYLLNSLKRAGLQAGETEEADLRREIGVPVHGLLVVGKRP
jgi:predicted TPR repeat methyltransferase